MLQMVMTEDRPTDTSTTHELREEFIAMTQSLCEEIRKSGCNIIAIVITLHSITVSAIFAAAALF
ncbi:MAG: hypothetical protein ACKOIZ_03740 [Actinomycetota bacterium]